MASEKFRYQLRQEAQQWQEEGLIDLDLYEQLAIRYQLNELDSTSRDRFIFVVLGVGFILLGLGVITFVAANWQTWSKSVRVILLLSLFITTNCGGFYFWKSPDNRQSRLGQGLLLLGALTMGANLGLLSQMFHQTGSVYVLYLVWGLGVWGMAFSLRLTSLGFLSIILIAIAYCIGLFENVFWEGIGLGLALQQMSLIISCLFIPLAYYSRSGWIFGLSSIFIICSLGINIGQYLNDANLSDGSFFTPLLLILLPALFWGYRDRLLFGNFNLDFDSISRKLAIFCLGLFIYICSFNLSNNFEISESGKLIDFTPRLLLIAPLIFTIFSIYAWWRLGVRRDSNLPWRLDRNSTYVGATLVFIFCSIWFHLAIAPLGIAGTIIFNLLLFALAIMLISQSVRQGQRFNFWLGILLVILQIFSRMFEYNSDLILKAIALFICGVAAIMAGLWFEHYLNSQNLNSHSLNS